MDFKKFVREVPNFPKEGVVFRDISPLLADGDHFSQVIDVMCDKVGDVDAIVAPDARGFIFGAPIAAKLKKPLILVRKAGKLPGEILSKDFTLEYATTTLEIQKDAIKPGQKVAIIDDLLATGGTTRAAAELINDLGGKVLNVLFFIELEHLKGREKYSGINVESIIKY